jgi:hypothetical protein
MLCEPVIFLIVSAEYLFLVLLHHAVYLLFSSLNIEICQQGEKRFSMQNVLAVGGSEVTFAVTHIVDSIEYVGLTHTIRSHYTVYLVTEFEGGFTVIFKMLKR